MYSFVTKWYSSYRQSRVNVGLILFSHQFSRWWVASLLLLSHFSRVWLCETPQTAAHQAPPSLGSSRQEHSSGLSFPSPMHKNEKWNWSRPAVSDSSWPHGLQPTMPLVHGIFQARVLEWVAIAFSSCFLIILQRVYTHMCTHTQSL